MPQKPAGDYLSTRRTLISRLKNLEDTGSWKEYYDTYGPIIYRFSLKQGLTDYEAQEVVQETSIAVSRNIKNFQYVGGKGSFKAWLFNLIRWRVKDQWRKRKKIPLPIHQDTPTGGTSATNRIPDPKGDAWNTMWEEEWCKDVLEKALLRVKNRQDPKHYQIYHLYALEKLPAATVAEMFEVTCDQIYVIKTRISSILKKEIEYVESNWI